MIHFLSISAGVAEKVFMDEFPFEVGRNEESPPGV